MNAELILWIVFGVAIVILLTLDLSVFHRHAHVIYFREALLWSAIWIAVALLFNLAVFLVLGKQSGLEFLTGYLIEKSLSVDNLFVFLLIFTYFQVPREYQHKVLFWGIVGALVMRGAFIAAGITILELFHWAVFVFGGFLILSGIKLGVSKDKQVNPERNLVLRLFRKLAPTTKDYRGSGFLVKVGGRRLATPLLLVLVVVETTDIIFALDSIPAILAITTDPFIVYTSNAFAILGLRALYFALAGLMLLFHHLHYGLSAILIFVGVKMVGSEFYEVPVVLALLVVGGLLGASIATSLLFPPKKKSSLEESPE